MKKKILKAALTVCFSALAIVLFCPLCKDGDGCDYLKLWLFAGIPFGIRRMFLWIVPKGHGIGGTAGVLALDILIGGLIGGVVMVWQVCAAVCTLARAFASCTVRWFRRHRKR